METVFTTKDMVILHAQADESQMRSVGLFFRENDKRDKTDRLSHKWISADYLTTHLFPTFENSNSQLPSCPFTYET